jgi:Domain of unknown function (DUF929)
MSGAVRTRGRLLLVGGSMAVVIALVVALIVVKVGQGPAPSAVGASPQPLTRVSREIATVRAATFDAVGAGSATGLKTVTGPPALTRAGKPEVLYIGGGSSPYCAAERWALATALGRFGTLSGLSLIHSSPTGVDPGPPTISFARARYTSPWVSFAYLPQPTAAEKALFTSYGNRSAPFVDIGNRYLLPQVQYLPSALAGMSWDQIAAALHDPASAVAKDIDGAANIIAAAIASLTGGQPAAVAHSAGVQAARGSL